MDTQSFWWSSLGPFRPKDMRKKYPHPGDVIAYVRVQREMTRQELAQKLGLSVSEICRMEKDGVGLDSIACCRKLAVLLQIPASLLSLDSLAHQEISWWIREHYPPFAPGDDNYPLPGSLIKYYRMLRLREIQHTSDLGEERWTQHGLAEALGVSEFTIRKMENNNKGLDSLSRRQTLVFLLNIPPVLLGLDSLPHDSPLIQDPQPFVARLKQRTITLEANALDTYRLRQKTLWTDYFTYDGQDAVGKAVRELRRLQEIAPLTRGAQHAGILELLSLCHQFIAAVALERRDFSTLFTHENLAVSYAREREKADLLATALLRRGMACYGQSNLPGAIKDINEATTLVEGASDHVKGTVLQNAGMFHASVFQDEEDRQTALDWLDRAEHIARSGDFTDDSYFLKFNVGMYHIRRAISLIAVGRSSEQLRKTSLLEALRELELAEKGTSFEMTRRHAMINLFRAQAHCGLGEFCFATKEALQALQVFKSIRSAINIGYIAELYHELRTSIYGTAPLVLRLGWQLEELGNV